MPTSERTTANVHFRSVRTGVSMQHLHLQYKDGTIEHVEFTRQTWEQFYGDPSIKSQWTHLPHDCHHPAARHWAQLRRSGFPQTPASHALADMDDPNWSGDRSLSVEPHITRVPDPEPIIWPPSSRLTSRELHLLCHLGIEDARTFWLPTVEVMEPPKKIDEVGQWSLF